MKMATEPCIVQSCARAGEGEDANAASANTANADDERIRPASVDAPRASTTPNLDRDVGQMRCRCRDEVAQHYQRLSTKASK